MVDEFHRLKPGDKVFRPRRIKRHRLRHILGIPALFSTGYGDVGSSIYYALGIVALVALGATPIVLAIAGIIYIFNALTYAEGSAMLPEAGGSASFARHAFNDMGGFVGGWALMLSYILTITVSAYTIPPYLSHFWPMLANPAVGTSLSMGIILFLMLINIIGVRESANLNIVFIALDIAMQLTLVTLGIMLILLVNPQTLFNNMFGPGNWPPTQNLIFGVALAALAFTGVESVSQVAQEARRPAEQVPKTYILMIITVLLLFSGISIVALSAMTPQMLGDPVNGWARDPVAGIAANLPSELLRDIFEPLVAVLAASILLTATNAGVMGVSRLAFSLSLHQQLPGNFSRIHGRFRTPHISIVTFCMVAFVLLIPGFIFTDFFADLGALYAFGSLLSFAVAHAAIIRLRVKEPKLHRPFKMRPNFNVRGYEIPVVSVLGLLATLAVWVVLTTGQPFTRMVGFVWMLGGILGYLVYRRRRHIPLGHEAPPAAPTSYRGLR